MLGGMAVAAAEIRDRERERERRVRPEVSEKMQPLSDFTGHDE